MPAKGKMMSANAQPRPPAGDWLGTPYLRFEREGVFAVCTVDRPEARNALTPAMYFGLRYVINRVDRDPAVAGLLLTATGGTFVPGGDLGKSGTDDWLDFETALGMDVTPFDTLRRSAKPVVCAVNGLCQGGGLMIALCSDLAVVSDRASFRVPELLRGIADTYYAQVLARVVGVVRARDLLLTGRTLSAQEALDWGLVSRVVPHDELLGAATEALAQICRTAPAARREIKASLDGYLGHFARIAMESSLAGPEALEGLQAFKQRRSPHWVPAELRRDGRL